VRGAQSASSQFNADAIADVARDCGSLSIECSDVAGYVEGVAERIGEHLKVLDTLEEVTTRLLADQARVSDSTDEARLLSEQAKAKLEAGREAIDGTIQGFKGLTELVVQLGERMAGFASAMNQVQTVSSTIETMRARKPVRIEATATTVITPTTMPSTVRALRNLCARIVPSAIETVSVGMSDLIFIANFQFFESATIGSSREALNAG